MNILKKLNDCGQKQWPNYCLETAIEALRYLAENERPDGGNSSFNSEHLYQIADEIEHYINKNTKGGNTNG